MQCALFTISAVIPAGKHLFPFRTEKLSLPGPMVLGGQPPGRVGRRRFNFAEPAPSARALLVSGELRCTFPRDRPDRRASRACPFAAAIGVAASNFGGGGGAKPRLMPLTNRLRRRGASRASSGPAPGGVGCGR